MEKGSGSDSELDMEMVDKILKMQGNEGETIEDKGD